MNIKKNDTVIVLSGKDKGKKGKVLTAMPKDNKGRSSRASISHPAM
jgi:large subunit ribosomal protein L24